MRSVIFITASLAAVFAENRSLKRLL